MSIETQRWAQTIESLRSEPRDRKVCDVLVIGSGYGGSFAARELAATGDVWVVERGREYALGEFPEDIGSLPGHVRYSRRSKAQITGRPEGLFDIRMFDDLSVLVANGLGGGSLINAGVALQPDPDTIRGPDWPAELAGPRKGELIRAMEEVASTLQAAPLTGASSLAKFQALAELAARAGMSEAVPAPLTIASEGRTNAAGLKQAGCTRCGNCLTGCNVGAKNTLVSHVIPMAAQEGVRFFTGATALSIEARTGQSGRTDTGMPVRWRVHFAATSNTKGQPDQTAEFHIDAHVVILAAGTLGSTELLLRSTSLDLSGRLGQRFSTNGDTIAMGWGMTPRVNAISAPRPDSAAPSTDVGPTIVGLARARLDVGGREVDVLLQDGAIPSALAQVGIVLGSTLSLPHRYVRDELPGALPRGSDPHAVRADLGEHALLLLGIGTDVHTGCMSLTPRGQQTRGKNRPPGKLRIQWPDLGHKPERSYHGVFDAMLTRAAEAGGFQGGDYLANPAWRPLPADFSLAGGDPPHKMISVHPLGGCPMGDNAARGVVDWKGAVFRGDGQGVHEGLFVMDGSMVPSSLGVNPFVTIAALSLLAARQLRADLTARDRPAVPAPQRPLPMAQPSVEPLPFQPAGPIQLAFEERLQGEVAGATPAWLQALGADGVDGPAFGQQRAWVARIRVELDLYSWLADPNRSLQAHFDLFRNPFPQELSVHGEAVRGKPVLSGAGTVRLLALDAPANGHALKRRAWMAIRTYVNRRSQRDLQGATGAGGNVVKAVAGFKRAARNHALYRLLTYDFTLRRQGADHDDVSLCGGKKLAFEADAKNIWDALTELDLQLTPPGAIGPPVELRLKVDLVDMVRKRRLQVRQAPSTPAAIVGLAAFSSMWLRSFFTTHFWSFRGTTAAEKLVAMQAAEHAPLWPSGLLGLRSDPDRIKLAVPRGGRHPGESIDLELTRYQPAATGNSEHVLLIHGLAHGGTVFTTETIERNMATEFLAQGYTVWVLDHRLSNRLPWGLQNHTIDDVARHDIPAAVRVVHGCAGRPIKVFAHCVGAGAFAMAALSGELGSGAKSMVGSAVLHAVHPWVVPSVSNQFSAALAALYKDFLEDDDSVDPLPPMAPGKSGFRDQLLDRFAASIPWHGTELEDHEKDKYHPNAGCAVCNRMTVYFGREWIHGNLCEKTHEQLASLVGPSGIEVFRHLFFIMLRERLTNREGANPYLTEDNLRDHFAFPVLFCHGRENQVFDPRSAVHSWHRLCRIRAFHRQHEPVEIFIAKGYGHMDFLFGKNACRDVFPAILGFMRDPYRYDGGWRWREDEDAAPIPPTDEDWELSDFHFKAAQSVVTGPMVQLARRGDKRQLVVWFEQQRGTSEAVFPGLSLQSTAEPLPTWTAEDLTSERFGAPKNGTIVDGAGVFWACTLEESFSGQFRGLGRVRLGPSTRGPRIKTRDAVLVPMQWKDGAVPADPPGSPRRRLIEAQGRDEPRTPYDDEVAPSLDWRHLPWWQRWVGVPVTHPVSWLATSCRWPGLPFEREGADSLALAMTQHVDGGELPVDAMVMLGDQIYADATADVADTAERGERGAQRYRDAWDAKSATGQLLAMLPTYFVVDDHEFHDGWSAGGNPALDQDFMNGFEAAYAYQWRWNHPVAEGPRVTPEGRVRGFWREFAIGDVPAFLADTRTERCAKPATDWAQADLMSPTQAAALECWLLAHRDVPKVICSGSVFGVPEEGLLRDPALCRSADGWFGYPGSWKRLAGFLAVNQIRNVIFLAGDYHLSAVAELHIEAPGVMPVRAISVVASGWNATLPFANRRARDLRCGEQVRAPLSGPEVDLWSTTRLLSTAPRQFSKLSLLPDPRGWLLQISAYGPNPGERLNEMRVRL